MLMLLGFRFGVRYGDFWGHRGFTHSLIFAALTASVALILGFWDGGVVVGRLYLWAASHALLDAMTDGGLGVAFFSPFDNHRYFLPWRPIHVSPIVFERFFTTRGLLVIENELLWIWLPVALLMAGAWIFNRHSLRSS